MIDYIPIVPTAFLKGKFTTLCLAHLIEKDNEYLKKCLEFQKKRGKIILDNSYYELKRNMTPEECVEKLSLLNPYAFCLPDIPLSRHTRGILGEYIRVIRESGYKGKLWGVVTVMNDFNKELSLFKILNTIEEIDTIAVPYHFDGGGYYKRPEFLEMVNKEIKVHKKVHIFGINSLINLKYETAYPWVVSCDSTIAWKCGYLGYSLPICSKLEPGRPEGYFDIKEINKDQRRLIKENMKWMEEYLK